jgi:hypothetical protein
MGSEFVFSIDILPKLRLSTFYRMSPLNGVENLRLRNYQCLSCLVEGN